MTHSAPTPAIPFSAFAPRPQTKFPLQPCLRILQVSSFRTQLWVNLHASPSPSFCHSRNRSDACNYEMLPRKILTCASLFEVSRLEDRLYSRFYKTTFRARVAAPFFPRSWPTRWYSLLLSLCFALRYLMVGHPPSFPGPRQPASRLLLPKLFFLSSHPALSEEDREDSLCWSPLRPLQHSGLFDGLRHFRGSVVLTLRSSPLI